MSLDMLWAGLTKAGAWRNNGGAAEVMEDRMQIICPTCGRPFPNLNETLALGFVLMEDSKMRIKESCRIIDDFRRATNNQPATTCPTDRVSTP